MTDKFFELLCDQLRRHPSALPQDIVKLCYQAAFGAEHLLADVHAARAYFDAEYDAVKPASGEPYELLSEDVCRINLAGWKSRGLPREWLFNMFLQSATPREGGEALFARYLDAVPSVLESTGCAFSFDDWRAYVDSYLESGGGAVHHSERYRKCERPAYRIVKSEFLNILPILCAAAPLAAGEGVKVIAVDGRAASGKSTAAALLAPILGAGVIHMDDFFLPPELRTAERLSEPGGNVHYERFAEQVLPHLHEKTAFSYDIFDCSRMKMGAERKVDAGEWRIVEGAYSHHPVFGNYADLRVFSDVAPDEQMRRIIARDGERMAKMFRDRWIPMEERYIEYFGIKQRADAVIGEL
ncbi:MAG: hypothetical protein IJY27_01445 [Clostridia bacterium]|nr:hypothetical protein [Clostridia bacterium]